MSVYPYKRMRIVTTASHPIFSFHCILLFLFLPSFLEIPWSSIIMVPTEYLQEYKNAFGSNYKYIYAWNPDETGDDNKPVTQCSTPSVSYESGKLMFACETAGAKYRYTITDTSEQSRKCYDHNKSKVSVCNN